MVGGRTEITISERIVRQSRRSEEVEGRVKESVYIRRGGCVHKEGRVKVRENHRRKVS